MSFGDSYFLSPHIVRDLFRFYSVQTGALLVVGDILFSRHVTLPCSVQNIRLILADSRQKARGRVGFRCFFEVRTLGCVHLGHWTPPTNNFSTESTAVSQTLLHPQVVTPLPVQTDLVFDRLKETGPGL